MSKEYQIGILGVPGVPAVIIEKEVGVYAITVHTQADRFPPRVIHQADPNYWIIHALASRVEALEALSPG